MPRTHFDTCCGTFSQDLKKNDDPQTIPSSPQNKLTKLASIKKTVLT